MTVKEALTMPKVTEKKCSQCGKSKSLKTGFYKNRSTPDGHEYMCIVCKVLYRQAQPVKKDDQRRGRGIEYWGQVDSVLREMAELQQAINTETSLCEQRVAMIKGDTQRIIEPAVTHQIGLRCMLEDFIKEKSVGADTKDKLFRFGSVRYGRKKLIAIKLDVELASSLRGKP